MCLAYRGLVTLRSLYTFLLFMGARSIGAWTGVVLDVQMHWRWCLELADDRVGVIVSDLHILRLQVAIVSKHRSESQVLCYSNWFL